MRKIGLFVMSCLMCGGLAAQEIEISSDTIRSEMDSLQLTSPALATPKAAKAGKQVIASSPKKNVPSLEVLNFWQMLQNFRKDYDAQLERWDDIYLLITGIRPNPDYYKLSMPATYYEAPIEQAFSISDWKPEIPL